MKVCFEGIVGETRASERAALPTPALFLLLRRQAMRAPRPGGVPRGQFLQQRQGPAISLLCGYRTLAAHKWRMAGDSVAGIIKVIVEVQRSNRRRADSPGQFFIFRDGIKWDENLLRGHCWRDHG